MSISNLYSRVGRREDKGAENNTRNSKARLRAGPYHTHNTSRTRRSVSIYCTDLDRFAEERGFGGELGGPCPRDVPFSDLTSDYLGFVVIVAHIASVFLRWVSSAMATPRRSLLAVLWSIVGLLTLTSFVIAILFAYRTHRNSMTSDDAEGENEDWE